MTSKVTEIIKEKSNISISIKGVSFRPFTQLVLQDVLISDLKNDTLLCTKELTASIFGLSIKNGSYTLYGVSLLNPHINFVVDTSGMLNLTELLDTAFPKDSSKTKDGKFELSIRNVKLINAHFYYGKAKHDTTDYGVNFKDMRLRNLNIDGRNFCVVGDTIALVINSLSFVEQSGLKINDLRSIFSISNRAMNFYKFRVKTDDSEIALTKLLLQYNGYDKLSNFTQDVKIDADFTSTSVNSNFISYFAPSLRGYNIQLGINGVVKGHVNELRGRKLEIMYGNGTKICTNINLSGLPDINQTLFDVDFEELSTQYPDLKNLTDANGKPLINAPPLIDTLGKITYKGKFVGYLNNFVAYGAVSTKIGDLKLDASFIPQKHGGFRYKGRVDALDIDVGKIAGSEILGKSSLSAQVNGSSDKHNNISAKTNIDIKSIIANSYNYSDIKIEGDLTNRTYIGTINLNDPNCKVNFLGKLDFSDSIPDFDFSAFVPRIDLVALNLNKDDSISIASFLLTTKFAGNSLDNSHGKIKLVNSTYRNQRGDFKLSEVAVTADNSSTNRVVTLKSEFAEGELRGKYNYSSVFRYISGLLSNYIPALTKGREPSIHSASKTKRLEQNDYLLKLRIKKTKKITNILFPSLELAENTSIFGILNPDLETLTFKMKIPEITLNGNIIKDLSIDGHTDDSLLTTVITSPNITIGNALIKNFNINLKANNNKLDFDLNWDNKNSPENKGRITANVDFNSYKIDGHIAQINFTPSSFVINDSLWQIEPTKITVDTAAIGIGKFVANSNSQSLVINGTISKQETDTLSLALNNLNIAALNLYLNNMGYSVDGSITGEAKINNLYENPNLFADIEISNMLLNSEQIGNIVFKSQWFNNQKRMGIRLTNQQNSNTTLQAQGFIYAQSNLLDIDVYINQIKLKHLAPLLEGNVSDIEGSINGKLKVGGSLSEPALNGSINVENTHLTVDFLKTRYTINSPITISNSDLLFKNFTITDVFNNVATLNGSITTQHFKNISMNLNLATKNFQCMNTTEHDNQSFYASAYGSGVVLINGSPQKLNMSIYIKTDNKTAIYLPLSNSSTVKENNFLTFVSNNEEDIDIDNELDTDFMPQKPSSELNLSLEIQVTPEAEAQIIIDKKMGDIIKANGRGNLKIEINPTKDIFKMLGSYEIEKGEYLFTLKSLLNKKLKIENGSSITWNGDPLDANTNITATYQVKTSLKPILGENYTARIPVDCQILLTQKLMSPNIEFNITLPNGNSDEKAALETALNTQEKINTQFLGLLGVNSFISDASVNSSSTENANLGTMGLYNTVSELLSNQLSNLLSNDKLDFGINYRPGIDEELTSDQVELALSTQIFDDRLLLNGSAFNNNKNNASAPIAGNFNAEFKLNKSGKLRAKAFARYNDDFLNTITTNENEYTTGVGIMYREEFNNFRELRYKMRHIFSSETPNRFNFGEEVLDTDSSQNANK